MARWLKWLACLAASIFYGSARAATGDNPAPPAASAPASATAPAPGPPTASVSIAGPSAAAALAASATTAKLNPPMPSREEMGMRNAQVHDPSTIVKCKDEYWVFNTGNGIISWHSKDLIHWERGRPVFSAPPSWIADAVPGNRGVGFWAPDVMFYHGRYLLYYAVSTFGSQTSGIGLATSPTLDQSDPAYQWTDQGLVIRSRARRDYPDSTDNFNAIDPAIIASPDGKLWLSFGSFWSGIKLIELDPATGQRLAPDSPIYPLATNNNPQHDVEASYIYPHDGYYYLFVNWGKCCQGVASTYKIMMGRSQAITGPYLDKAGVDLAKGGGTLFIGSEGDFIGPGHAGIIEADGKFWFSGHFYDGATARGTSMLFTRPLQWESDGWPALEPKQNYVAENTRVAPARGARGANPGGAGARGRGRAGTGRGAGSAPAGTAGTASPPAGTGTPTGAVQPT